MPNHFKYGWKAALTNRRTIYIWTFLKELWSICSRPSGTRSSKPRICFNFFCKGCHRPGGSFIYWAQLTSLTSKANALSTNPSHKWTDKLYSNQKSPCWHRVSCLWPSDPDLLWFAAIPSQQDLAIFTAPQGQALFTFQQFPASKVWDTVQTFQRCNLKEFAAHLVGIHAPATEPVFCLCQQHLDSQVVFIPSTFLTQCSLTSVFYGNWFYLHGMVHWQGFINCGRNLDWLEVGIVVWNKKVMGSISNFEQTQKIMEDKSSWIEVPVA